jgi:hypothetical protein
MKKYIVLLFFTIISNQIQSQSYFPLHVGDRYVYKYESIVWSFPNPSIYSWHYATMDVLQDSIIGGKKYFLVSWFPYLNYRLLRVDSVSGSLYCFDEVNSCSYYYYEKLVDSLSMTSGVENSCSGWQVGNFEQQIIFGQNTYSKTFYHTTTANYSRTYNSVFGLIKYYYGVSYYHSGVEGTGNLRGCIINGYLYGDTLVTDLNNISTNIPQEFVLYQNYPNPFNPVTKINYELPKEGTVKLVVFDILGREIRTLVNEFKKAGNYSVDFDGTRYASGVYFYRIQIDGKEKFADVKKMILIK